MGSVRSLLVLMTLIALVHSLDIRCGGSEYQFPSLVHYVNHGATTVVFSELEMCQNSEIPTGNKSVSIMVFDFGCDRQTMIEVANELGYGGLLIYNHFFVMGYESLFIPESFYVPLNLSLVEVRDHPDLSTLSTLMMEDCPDGATVVDWFTAESRDYSQFYSNPFVVITQGVILGLNVFCLVVTCITLRLLYLQKKIVLINGTVVFVSILSSIVGIVAFVGELLLIYVVWPRFLKKVTFDIQYPLVIFCNLLIVSTTVSALTMNIKKNWEKRIKHMLYILSSLTIVFFLILLVKSYLQLEHNFKGAQYLGYITGFYNMITALFLTILSLYLYRKYKSRSRMVDNARILAIFLYVLYIVSIIGVIVGANSIAIYYMFLILFLNQGILMLWNLFWIYPRRIRPSDRASSKSAKSQLPRPKSITSTTGNIEPIKPRSTSSLDSDISTETFSSTSSGITDSL
eukprot:TRINITY_DN7652_c0_g1_i1.p1 TRINITY_DN7652_c0_g1~~TRINITY_DN7652_c0_g1_i1.p1  ORF type:complete len:458 (-),score=34.76 TRINITY_DN7652_c0_g1_i1:30-1403(-)